jgi:protein-serine/threonine kinase
MLAGYLPFDDDPANPEGDNINLLYKYIVSTPLTFPEYVTPHARDLLRRILVPDPRKRADLFEVARHSWLSEYSHVVGFITSSTTTSVDIGNATIPSEDEGTPLLARSASVREPSKTQKSTPTVGDLSRKHGNVDQDAVESHAKLNKDNKRRTVQVEYVAPRSQTQRGEPSTVTAPSAPRTRARAGSQGPVEVPSVQPTSRRVLSTEKPLPQDPPIPRDAQYSAQGRLPSSSQRQQAMAPPSRPGREPRAVSDANYISHNAPPVSIARPNTGGSMTSTGSRSGALPNRSSYSQPAAPQLEGTNAQGRMAQPKNSRQYIISAPVMQDEQSDFGRPSSNQVPPKFARVAGFPEGSAQPEPKSHKRSNTIGGIFSRTNSIFGGKSGRNATNAEQSQEKPKKSYPPVSMSGAVGQTDTPRQSMDSRRSISFGFGKKRSGSMTRSQTPTQQDKPRRFSLLPASFSLKAIGIGKEYGTPGGPPSDHYDSRTDIPGYLDPPQTSRTDGTRNISGSMSEYPRTADGTYDRTRGSPILDRRNISTAEPSQHQRYTSQSIKDPRSGAPPQFLPPMNFRQGESALTTESESSINDTMQNRRPPYPTGFNEYDDRRPVQSSGLGKSGTTSGRGVLQKNNRKFTDAYETEQNNGFGTHADNAGSSGAARKVMDFFRRRGKARGDDR